MNVLINRKALLREILQIERDIKKMKRNPRYVRIKSNINNLESKRFGSQIVSISAPDNPEITLEIRNNSQKMKDIILKYKEMRSEFDDRLDELVIRKSQLQKQLFNS